VFSKRRGCAHFFANSDDVKKYAAALRAEMERRRLSFSPIMWLYAGTAGCPSSSGLCRRSLRATGGRKNRDTPKASRLLFASAESYLLSFGASLFMLSSDFVVFLELFFFFILALAFIGLSVFMESCAAGAVV
jgi:hypothetical protein